MATETKRGFVQKIEIGRAGLVVITLLHEDRSVADYRIQDIDGDPERFNEQLSKLGVLRDAMTRAEPVEVEYSQEGSGPRLIERVGRITRDSNELAQRIEVIDALIVGVAVFAENRPALAGERPDTAALLVLTEALGTRSLTLDLQVPERGVSSGQLQMIMDAQRAGRPLRFWLDPSSGRISGVGNDASSQGFGNVGELRVDGFVESLASSSGTDSADLALVRFTTAPPFAGAGNVVALVAFTPETIDLLVFKGSSDYALFEAGLRDSLRMRVRAVQVEPSDGGKPRNDGGRASGSGRDITGSEPSSRPSSSAGALLRSTAGTGATGEVVLVTGAELLAALASASRPVWIRISRKSLDHGPDGVGCTEGVPSSDLSPMSLRDLRLPYPAEWVGWGCFNHGVYRFQFELDVEFEIWVDGELLCVHEGETDGVKFAHACLGGEHEVRVKAVGWTCDKRFVMDVYRIR